MTKISKNKGFMMIEILVATSIIAVAILAAMTVSQKSVYVSRQAFHATQAAFLLEEGAEAVRILRDDDWVNISSLTEATDYYPTFTGLTWTLSPTANNVGIFTRTVQIGGVSRDDSTADISEAGTSDPGTKLVTVTVSWVEGGVTITKTLPFYIMDIFS
jgi:Tfp pilus assembly protein PilV